MTVMEFIVKSCGWLFNMFFQMFLKFLLIQYEGEKGEQDEASGCHG